MALRDLSLEERKRRRSVFINIPFDSRYEKLFLTVISGLVGLGLTPRCALELPASTDRLRRIFTLLEQCGSSIHDLSRVQLSRRHPRCPRFNMPFEAGLATALVLQNKSHERFVFESVPYRLQKSLSDLNGADPLIHRDTVKGLLRGLMDAYKRERKEPTFEELFGLYRLVRRQAQTIHGKYGSLFTRTAFQEIVVSANISREILAAGRS